jgi:hypothetical protein
MHSNAHILRDHAADITARRIAAAAAVPVRRRRRNPMTALAGLLPATARRRTAQPVQ